MTTSNLSITCFEQFEVQREDNSLVHFPTEQTRALVLYLLLEGREPQQRSELAALLWPIIPLSKARENLRQTLARLKKALSITPKELHPALQITSKTLQFTTQQLQVDVWDFEKRTRSWELWQPGVLQDLEKAVHLYTGHLLQHNPPKSSDDFGHWLTQKANALRQRAYRLFQALSTYYREEELSQHRLQLTEVWSRLFPHEDTPQEHRLSALSAVGNLDKAITEYQQYKERLLKEYKEKPGKALQGFYRNIIQSEEQASYPASHEAEELSQPDHLLNVSADMTPFVGRTDWIQQILGQLKSSPGEFVTILGMGGVGKTRLSIEVARQIRSLNLFPDGIVYVPLADLQEPTHLASSIRQALNLIAHDRKTPQQQMKEYLQGKRCLLVLDNFEHLLPQGAEELAELLDETVSTSCLISSRLPLELDDETTIQLTGMDFPATEHSTEDLLEYDALQLFVQTAQRVHPTFESQKESSLIRAICECVHGIPLSIQIAAAWLWKMDCQELMTRLQDNIHKMEHTFRDIPKRHQSLYMVLEGTWQLLSPQEQEVLAGLSVFTGGFTLQSAQQVVGAEHSTLQKLRDAALIQGRERFTLHALVREFAAEKRVGTKTHEKSHSQYFLTLLQENEGILRGKSPLATKSTLVPELGNIQTAVYWSIEHEHFQTLEAALGGLLQFCELSGFLQEMNAMLAQLALKLEAVQDTSVHYIRVLTEQMHFASLTDAYAKAEQLGEKILSLTAPSSFPALKAKLILAKLIQFKGDLPLSNQMCQEVEKELSHRQGPEVNELLSICFAVQGANHYIGHRDGSCEGLYRQAITYAKASHNEMYATELLSKLSKYYYNIQKFDEVFNCLTPALEQSRKLGYTSIEARILGILATTESHLGNYDRAFLHLERSLLLLKRFGIHEERTKMFSVSGYLNALLRRFYPALQNTLKALSMGQTMGLWEIICSSHTNIGSIFTFLGDFEQSEEHNQTALQMAQERETFYCVDTVYISKARCALWRKEYQWALECTQKSLDIATKRKAFSVVAIANWTRGVIYYHMEDYQASKDCLKRSLEHFQGLNQHLRGLDPLTALIDTLLAMGELEEAAHLVEQGLHAVEHHLPKDMLGLQLFYDACYRCFLAQNDTRAHHYAQLAKRMLNKHLAHIADPHLRHTLVHNIPQNVRIHQLSLDS